MKNSCKKKNSDKNGVQALSEIIKTTSNAIIKKDAEKNKLEEILLISETRYRRLFETAQDGILILDYDTGKIVDANPFILKMIGYTKKQIIGKALWEIGAFSDITKSKKAFRELQLKKYIRYEDKPLQKIGGDLAYVEFISNVYLVDNTKVIQCNIRDITPKKLAKEQLKHLAMFDFLTDLPNRILLELTLNKEISRAARHNFILAVFSMDIDKFKDVNDKYGHDIGDELLQRLGNRIKKSIRQEDFVARISGDEFIVILSNINKVAKVGKIAQKIINNIKKPLSINRHNIKVTISIGISLFPYDGKKRISLLKKADIALYKAKEKGRNNYQFSSDK